MEFFIIALIVVIGFSVLSSGSIRSNSSISKKSAHEIADEVTTITQFRALEKKVERADLKRRNASSYDQRSYRAECRADDRYELLEEALSLVSRKIFRWQFIPDVDLGTSLKIANNSHKVFPKLEYMEKLVEFGRGKDEWYGLDGYDEPEEKDDELKFVVKFRKIVENPELGAVEINRKINSLVSRNRELASEFFDLDSPEKPSEQWRKENS